MNKERNFDELLQAVTQWGIDYGISDPKNFPNQFMAFIGEAGELAQASKKNLRDEEIDAFGDILVTLIIAAKQRDVDLTHALNLAYDTISKRQGMTVDGRFIKKADLDLLSPKEFNALKAKATMINLKD